jgi:NAD(P)H-flavin reductase
MKAPECPFLTRIISLSPLHPEVVELTLSCPEGFTWNAGDFLWLKTANEEAKPFSIASASCESHIRLQIAHVDPIAHWLTILINEKEGYLSSAITQYQWPDQTHPIVCFAGGTGITPLFNLLQSHLAETKQPVQLYWGVRNQGVAYLCDSLDMLAKIYPHFSYQLILSAEAENQSSKMLHGFIPDLISQKMLPLPDSPLDVLICGPWLMVSHIRTALQAYQIHSLQS